MDGGLGDDELHGQEGNDFLIGKQGNDTLDGGDGNDTINATTGDDVVYDGAGRDVVLLSGGNDMVHNAQDATRDVFRWTALGQPSDTNPETDVIDFLDVWGSKTNDQLDFSQLGPRLVAEVYGSAEDSGAFAIFLNEAARQAGEASLVVEWNNGTPLAAINIGIQSNADIRIGLGWKVYDAVSGDTII
jgi:Ca2+-binding RTX toxin-like protein